MDNKELYNRQKLKDIRQALADYISSEGCSCCRNEQKHTEAQHKLAKLLRVQKYEDGSGYNFYKYKTRTI